MRAAALVATRLAAALVTMVLVVALGQGCSVGPDLGELCHRQAVAGCLPTADEASCVQESRVLSELADSGGCGAFSDFYYLCVDHAVDEGTCQGGALSSKCLEPFVKLLVCLSMSDDLEFPADVGSGRRCAAFDRAGEATVEFVEASGDCERDDECTVIDVSDACFDRCSHPVAKRALSSLPLIPGECDGFAESGCTVTHPPCDPPGTPRCVSGRCELE